MKTLEYKIRISVGIHARNALLLSNIASQFSSTICIKKGERVENSKKLMSVMTMRITCGDVVSFVIEGEDESEALAALQEFCDGNL